METPFYRKYNPIEHFDNLENDIQKCINNEQFFVAFVLIALGIEYLGALNDDNHFGKPKQSSKRIKDALGFFKNSWYKENEKFMVDMIRNTLIHQYRPGEETQLTHRSDSNEGVHLTKREGKRVFVVEEFFKDFKEAKQRMIKRLTEAGKIDSIKLTGDYMTVQEIVKVTTDGAVSVESPSGSVNTIPK